MIKLHLMFLITSILLLPFISKGQFSREQAIDLVQNQILVNEQPILYASNDIIPAEPRLILSNGQNISLPYQGNWVFFADDKPLANWDHSCR